MPQKAHSRIHLDGLRLEREFRQLDKSLKRLVKETEKDAKEVLISQARLFCVDLVHVTQPWGRGKKAQRSGQGAVSRDVGQVYLTESEIYSMIEQHSIEQAKAFYYHVKNGEFDKADKIARTVNIDIHGFDGGVKHQRSRNSRGRVSPGNRGKFAPKNSVDKYTKEIKKRVGFAKSGWADCAAQLGGTRGIPAWIKNQKGSMGEVKKNFNGKSLEIVIINKVKYIGKLVDNYHIKRAAQSRIRAIERLVKKVIEINAKNSLGK